MLKLVGICVIFGGILGGIVSWNENRRMKIGDMVLLEQFVSHAVYRLETEKVYVAELLEVTGEISDRLRDTFQDIVAKMQKNDCPFGERIWTEVWRKHRGEWNFSEQFLFLVTECAKGLFGDNLRENIDVLKHIREQMQIQIQEEKVQWREKQKVFTPVGILGGIMIVIILL